MESGKSIFGSQTSVITPVVSTPLVSMKNEDFNLNQLDKSIPEKREISPPTFKS